MPSDSQKTSSQTPVKQSVVGTTNMADSRVRSPPGPADERTAQSHDLMAELYWWVRHPVNDDLTSVLQSAADEIERLRADVIAFGAAWAGYWAHTHQLPPSHIASSHYDALHRAGARMDDLTRMEIASCCGCAVSDKETSGVGTVEWLDVEASLGEPMLPTGIVRWRQPLSTCALILEREWITDRPIWCEQSRIWARVP